MDVEAQNPFDHRRRRHVLSDIGSRLMSRCKVLLGFIKSPKKQLTELVIYVILLELASVLVDFLLGSTWPSRLVTLLLAFLCLSMTIYDHKRGRTADAIASGGVLKLLGITFSIIQFLDKLIRFFLLTVLGFKRVNYNIDFVLTLTFTIVEAWFVFKKDVDEVTQQGQPQELGTVDEITQQAHKFGYAMAYMFVYSLRERTHAYRNYVDDVPEEIKQRRLTEVIEAFRESTGECFDSQVGTVQLVLVEGPNKKAPDRKLVGKSDRGHRVSFIKTPLTDRDAAVTNKRNPVAGDDVEVRILRFSRASLQGQALAITKLNTVFKNVDEEAVACARS